MQTFRCSYISGITLLGYPAEVYVFGMQVLYKMLALPFMGLLFSYQLLPVFRDLAGISLYSVRKQKQCVVKSNTL